MSGKMVRFSISVQENVRRTWSILAGNPENLNGPSQNDQYYYSLTLTD